MTDTRYTQVGSLLIDIECELRRAGFWSSELPSPEALASVEPFCVDTLDFHQWLQFVLIPRMRELIETRAPLPSACNITAMAEEVWASDNSTQAIITSLLAFDTAINQSS
jgi:uncharacterized protein YqcC (DUF446 family)